MLNAFPIAVQGLFMKIPCRLKETVVLRQNMTL